MSFYAILISALPPMLTASSLPCRYSDRHECSFDYKAAGRDALAAANPVVIAERVTRF